jgi:hypothetical protein
MTPGALKNHRSGVIHDQAKLFHSSMQNTAEIRHTGQHTGHTTPNKSIHADALKAKPAYVLLFDNPAHQR